MWVARDENGTLKLFIEKPVRHAWRNNGFWEVFKFDKYDERRGYRESGFYIDKSLFPELKWEDEPIEVILINKGELCKEYLAQQKLSSDIEILPVHYTREHKMLEYLKHAYEVADEGDNWVTNDAGGQSFCKTIKEMVASTIKRVERDINVYDIKDEKVNNNN